MNELETLTAALADLDEEATLAIARELATQQMYPVVSVLHACQQAVGIVGERYERQEYYLAGLILAGELFKEVLAMFQSEIEAPAAAETAGLVLLGTVKGDIHDIGKNLFASALRSFGFLVIDLGVDVPKERFLEETTCRHPDVICLSGLITPAFGQMKATTELLRTSLQDPSYSPPVVLGGGTVDDKVCRYVGADCWSNDSMEGVRICQRLLLETHPENY